MLALWLDDGVGLKSDVPLPHVGEDEALIRVLCAGVCKTDVELVSGYKGFTGILGHEFVGIVIDCAVGMWIGKRVCAEINVTCGTCTRCTFGMPTQCANRSVLGILNRPGAFAEFVSVPIGNLHEVPDGMPNEVAVFTEPVAAAFQVLQTVALDSRTRVLVMGDGKLGLLCAQVAASTGARTTILGRHTTKLKVARSLGLHAAKAGEWTETEADVVIEATGSVGGLQAAFGLVRPRGTIVLKSTTARPYSIDMSPVVVKEITVAGSRCGPFDVALSALSDGRVRVTELISERYRLRDAVHALERAGARDTLKVLIDVDESEEKREPKLLRE